MNNDSQPYCKTVASSVMIPLHNSDQMIEIEPDNLPEDPDEVLDILIGEIAPLFVWLQIALLYGSKNMWDAFEKILLEATKPRTEEKYNDKRDKMDRIYILNSLSAYYIHRAEKEKDLSMKNELLGRSSVFLGFAREIDPVNSLTLVSLGNLEMAHGKSNEALQRFNQALEKDSFNIPAMLGKARILYNQKRYSEALTLYKNALKQKLDPSFILGIGYCYFYLNNNEKSKKAFERVLELEQNVNAYIGLAVLELNSDKTPVEKVKNAMSFIKMASQLERDNPVVLNYFADSFFYREDFDKVQQCALSAYNNSNVPEIKAESYYQMARMHQYQKNYNDAFNYYYKIWMENSKKDNAKAIYGLGQMYIQKGQIDSAIRCFESLLKTQPNNFEVHKVLGHLYAETKDGIKAVQHLKKASEMKQHDEEVWIELTHVEHTDVAFALHAMLKAKKIFEKKKQPLGYELLNNLAVLYHKNKDYVNAKQCYLEAVFNTSITAENSSSFMEQVLSPNFEIQTDHTTLIYNFARLLEDMDDFTHAETLYYNLIKHHPSYLDSYLRLTVNYASQNKLKDALDLCNIAIEVSPQNVLPHALMGYLYIKKEEWPKAQAKFEHILNNIEKSDNYTLLGMGNVYLQSLRADWADEKVEKNLQYGFQFFTSVLKSDNSNVYAAVSLGAIIGEKGYLDQAKDIFLRAKEQSSEIPEIYLNLASVYMSQKNYKSAITLYETCSKKFYDHKDLKVLHFLARAYYDDQDYEKAERVLLDCVALNSKKFVLSFDLAVVQNEMAQILLNKKMALMKGMTIEKAIEKATSALERMRNLAEQKEDEFISRKANNVVEQYSKTLNDLKQLQEAELKEKEARLELLKQMRVENEKLEAAKREEEARIELAKQQEEERTQRILEESRRQAEQLQLSLISKAQTSSEKKTKKGKRDNSEFVIHGEEEEEANPFQDSDDQDATGALDEEGKQRKRKKKEKSAKKSKEGTSDEKKSKKAAKRKDKKKDSDDGENDDDGSSKKRRKLTRKSDSSRREEEDAESVDDGKDEEEQRDQQEKDTEIDAGPSKVEVEGEEEFNF